VKKIFFATVTQEKFTNMKDFPTLLPQYATLQGYVIIEAKPPKSGQLITFK